MSASHQMSAKEFKERFGAVKNPNKFQAKRPVRADGLKFDSIKESRYYDSLCALQMAGQIAAIDIHPRWKIIINGIHVTTYTADFKLYYSTGEIEVIDVKSWITKRQNDYIIRKKLMKAIYGIDIVEK